MYCHILLIQKSVCSEYKIILSARRTCSRDYCWIKKKKKNHEKLIWEGSFISSTIIIRCVRKKNNIIQGCLRRQLVMCHTHHRIDSPAHPATDLCACPPPANARAPSLRRQWNDATPGVVCQVSDAPVRMFFFFFCFFASTLVWPPLRRRYPVPHSRHFPPRLARAPSAPQALAFRTVRPTACRPRRRHVSIAISASLLRPPVLLRRCFQCQG